MYAKTIPARLTAEQLQQITSHGCTMPMCNVIAFPTPDHFEIVRDLLAATGVHLQQIDKAQATPRRMTDKELLILSGWYRDQIHEIRGPH